MVFFAQVHSIYRSTGASFDKAKAEFATGVMSSPHVQQAAAGAARQAMSQAFTSATTGSNRPQNSGVRY